MFYFETSNPNLNAKIDKKTQELRRRSSEKWCKTINGGKDQTEEQSPEGYELYFMCLLVLKCSETQRKRRKSKPEKKGNAMHSLLSCLLGGCVWQENRKGEKSPAVITALKKFKLNLLLGVKDVIHSETGVWD